VLKLTEFNRVKYALCKFRKGYCPELKPFGAQAPEAVLDGGFIKVTIGCNLFKKLVKIQRQAVSLHG
jgi:hypothetical protein